MKTLSGLGLGLRKPHFEDILAKRTKAQWFEVITENYMGMDDVGVGPAIKRLLKVRESYPIVFHGVSLNIGGFDAIDLVYLKKLKELRGIVQPQWISDHVCWTTFQGMNTHELLPLPYDDDTLQHLVKRIDQVQNFLGHHILLENPSAYFQFSHSGLVEAEFLNELHKRTDVQILLDVNNVEVSAFNHKFDAVSYLNIINPNAVGQIHLAGHTTRDSYKIDTHNTFMSDECLRLFKHVSSLMGYKPTMIEWDADIPEMEVLDGELERVKRAIDEAAGDL